MRLKLLIISILTGTFALMAKDPCAMPESIDEIMQMATVRPMDRDSVNRYLRQDPSIGQEAVQKARYASLLECEFDGAPVLIYMAVYDWCIDIYACVDPYTRRYPSTLLLGRYDGASGVKNWYKIKDGKICTYALCDYWELVYVAAEEYEVKDGKFFQISLKEEPVITREDDPGHKSNEYAELYDLISTINFRSYDFLNLRDCLK